MPDVMHDLETLGTRPGCSILSIGAVPFDRKTGVVHEEMGFYTVILRDSCRAYGLREDSSTLEWWGKQSPEARKVLEDAENPDKAHSLPRALELFNIWLAKLDVPSGIRLWGNGSDFDNVILLAAYDACGIKQNWGLYNNRCYRTRAAEALHIKRERTGTHHNALDDAITQARHMILVDKEIGYAYSADRKGSRSAA